MKIAERFQNSLLVSNEDLELRKQITDEFQQYEIGNTITANETVIFRFQDESCMIMTKDGGLSAFNKFSDWCKLILLDSKSAKQYNMTALEIQKFKENLLNQIGDSYEE